MTTAHIRLGSWMLALASISLASHVRAQNVPLTIGEVLDSALRTHPALAAAQARVTAAEGGAAAARGARLPGVALVGALTLHQEPMVVAPLHSLNLGNPPAFDRTLVQSHLGVRHTLYDAGAGGSRVRAADATEEVTRSLRTSTEMRLLEETSIAYLSLATARTLLAAARAQVAALSEERARAERHVDAGSAARVELLTAEATLQEARAEESAAAARVGLAERLLARLMGVEPQTLTRLEIAPVVMRAPPLPDVPASSPVIRQAEQALTVAEARLSEERATRLPTVAASAGLLDFGAWERRHVLEWQAAIEVTWPLFAGARSAAVRRASSEAEAARADLDAARLQTAHELDEASTAIVTADARAAALSAAVVQWEEVARIEALALEAGAGEQRDLLRAEAGLFQARAGLAQATQDSLAARLRLARVEGVLSRAWMDEWMEGSR
jgi:multidrug efflux system outer membrane protein